MPQWDRYWPIGLASSVLLMAASLTLSVWYLASLFALPQRVGLPQQRPASPEPPTRTAP